MNSTLLPGRAGAGAVWTGQYVFLFGGTTGGAATAPSGTTNDILRYNPDQDTIETMNATLPTRRTDVAAAWDGTHVYLFGGQKDSTNPDSPPYAEDDILRYNPETDTLTNMSETLPSGRWGSSAVYDGSDIYIFGGAQGWGQDGSVQDPHTHLNEILKYDIDNETITTMNATFADGHHYMAGISDGDDPLDPYNSSRSFNGTFIYLFGGHHGPDDKHTYTDVVRQYHPSTDNLLEMETPLPHSLAWHGGSWNGTAAYTFGGYSGNDSVNYTGEIVRYTFTQDPPNNLSGEPGPQAGEISLAWDPPTENRLQKYRIFRDTTLIDEISGTQTSYVDVGITNDGTLHDYDIVAVGQDYGLESDNASVQVHAPSLPGPPQNLTGNSSEGSGTISLSWDPPPDMENNIDILNYRVYRGPPLGDLGLRAEIGNVTTYDDPCTVGESYDYELTAVNDVGEGAASNRITVTCT